MSNNILIPPVLRLKASASASGVTLVSISLRTPTGHRVSHSGRKRRSHYEVGVVREGPFKIEAIFDVQFYSSW